MPGDDLNPATEVPRDRSLRFLLAWLIAGAVLFVRDPAHLLQAQFWAEDGWFWYPDAYHHGAASLLTPVVGYFQTISRLIGLLAQSVPLRSAPTVFAACALLIQAAPAAFLVSHRMDRAWPDRRSRILLALLYAALPNASEVFDNVTNAQWHLAVLAFLVLASSPPNGRVGAVLDGSVLLVSGLSGPFCILLAPMALHRWWRERNGATSARAAVVLLTAAVQAGSLLAGVHTRSGSELGATPALLARIVVQQVIGGPLLGQGGMPILLDWTGWADDRAPFAAAAAGLILVAVAVRRGSSLLLYGLTFGVALLTAALARPQVEATLPQWPLIAMPGVGGRYFYIPMLVWLGVLFTVAARPGGWLRLIARLLLLGSLIGLWQDFDMPARPDTGFRAAAKRFERLPPGAAMSIVVLPLGFPTMDLVKHGR